VRRFIEHGFSDPSDVEWTEEEKIEAFRIIRNEIKTWVLDYFSSLRL